MSEQVKPASVWSPEYLAAIVDSSDDAIIGKTLDGTIISWNAGAERIYGYSADEVFGKSISILIPADLPNELPPIMARLRRGERIDHYKTVRVRKDGQRISVSLSISPVRDADGRIIGASAIARDISAQEAAIQAAMDLREQFISIAAHELRSPLSTFLARLQLVARRLTRPEIDREVLQHDVALAMKAADRLRLLLERLLDSSRIHSGQLELERTPADLAELLRNLTDEIAETTGREILVHAPELPGGVPAVVDGMRIEEVVVNVIDNAVKYSPEGPIEVDVSREGDALRVAVRDHGPGVPPGERELIFEPFYRSSADARGVGLGLHVAREIVHLHGGTLEVEDAEGGGARFVMTLPAENVGEEDALPSGERAH